MGLPREVDGEVSWYFAFTNNTRSNLLYRTCRDGFGHVFAFTQMGQFTLVVEPARHRVNMTIMETPVFDYALRCKDNGCVVARHKWNINDNDVMSVRNLFPSCVSQIKIITGLKSWGQWPYGLYKSLKRQGAEVI